MVAMATKTEPVVVELRGGPFHGYSTALERHHDVIRVHTFLGQRIVEAEYVRNGDSSVYRFTGCVD